jgi:hypothetical protein
MFLMLICSDRWLIPVNAEKPADARIKSGKYKKGG